MGGVGAEDPCQLGSRLADGAGNLGRRRLNEAHDPCTQFVERRQLGQCLDPGDIQQGVAACRAECGYFSVCGGGAPVNKLFENGSFTGTRTSYCTLTQIVPTDLILEAYDRLEQSWIPPEATEAVAPSPRTP